MVCLVEFENPVTMVYALHEFCCTVLHSFGQFLSRLYCCARKSRQISEAAFIAAEPYSEQYCTGCTEFKNSSRLFGFLDSRPYRPVEFFASDWHEKRGAVRYKDLLENAYVDLLNMLKTASEKCAIIYCLARNTCDDIGSRLLKDGISCCVYHAGLSDRVRSEALEDWTSGKVPVVVATVAFGELSELKCGVILDVLRLSCSELLLEWRPSENRKSIRDCLPVSGAPLATSPQLGRRNKCQIRSEGNFAAFGRFGLLLAGSLVLLAIVEGKKTPQRGLSFNRASKEGFFFQRSFLRIFLVDKSCKPSQGTSLVPEALGNPMSLCMLVSRNFAMPGAFSH
eukprot:Gb_28476 [translate_table: standard]